MAPLLSGPYSRVGFFVRAESQAWDITVWSTACHTLWSVARRTLMMQRIQPETWIVRVSCHPPEQIISSSVGEDCAATRLRSGGDTPTYHPAGYNFQGPLSRVYNFTFCVINRVVTENRLLSSLPNHILFADFMCLRGEMWNANLCIVIIVLNTVMHCPVLKRVTNYGYFS